MLNKNEVRGGYKLASMLNKDGKTFFVKKGSVVDELIKNNIDNIKPEEGSDIVETIVEASNDEAHQSIVENYAGEIAEKVSKMVKHGLGVVVPEIIRFYKHYQEVNVEQKVRSPEEYYNVSYVKLPPLADSAFVMDIFNGLKDGSAYQRTPISNLKELINDKLSPEFLHTGIGYVDESIDEFLSDVNMDDLKALTLTLAKDKQDGDILRATSSDPRLNEVGIALVQMLFFRKLASLRSEDGEHLQGLTVAAHNNYRFWSNILKRRWTAYKKAIADGVVICANGTDHALNDVAKLSDPNVPSKRINVYSESLSKLSEQNIDITALYGYILDGGNYLTVTINELAKECDKYSSLWDGKIKSIGYIARNFNISKAKWSLKKAYSDCFKESIKEASENGLFEGDDDEVKVSYVGELDRSKTAKQVSDYIDGLSPSQHISLFEASIDVVAGIRYGNYPIKDYLYNYINENHDGFDIDELAVRAIVSDYIGKFLLDNVVVGEIE